MLTIWSVVWTAFGRRIFGIEAMSSRLNIFMPITVVFSRDQAGRIELVRRRLLWHGAGSPGGVTTFVLAGLRRSCDRRLGSSHGWTDQMTAAYKTGEVKVHA
jgi:hypothetical protein